MRICKLIAQKGQKIWIYNSQERILTKEEGSLELFIA